jgi:kynurenine formamidase
MAPDFQLPSYVELQARKDGRPSGSAWGVFGDDDELGTVNLLTAARVLAGVREVRRGDVYSLNWRIDQPSPNPWRQPPKRTHLSGGNAVGRDDYLAPFYLQFSTQWDGLRHVRLPEGFYNGVSAEAVDAPDGTALGIQSWSTHALVGRGVLLDVAGHQAALGQAIDPSTRFEIGPELLDATAEAQSVQVQEGDVLLIRTGWTGWYEALSTSQRQEALTSHSPQPGLAPTEEIAAWLWDRHVAAVAADNTALEAAPLQFQGGRFLHPRLIAGLGLAIGEHFWLDDLTVACADDRRWSFFFTSVPLNVPGGVGSPPNALAIR